MSRLVLLLALQGCLIVVNDPDKDAVPDDSDDSDSTGDDSDPGPIDTDTVDTDVDTPDSDTVDTVDTDTVDTDAPTGPWSNTIVVDGDASDWSADELLPLGPGCGPAMRVTWDGLYIYVAWEHPDVAAGGPLHWVVLTLGDGGPGADAGVTIGTQLPALPFGGTSIVRWKADNSYNSLLDWDGTRWVNTDNWLGTQGSQVAESNARQTVELRMPRSVLGINDRLLLHANWVYEGDGFESSYCPVPDGSFRSPAYDPDYGAWMSFDLSAPDAPATYAPVTAQPVDTDLADDTDPVAADDTDPVAADDTDPVAADDTDPVAADDTDPVAADDTDPAVDTDPVAADDTDPAVDTDPVAADDTDPSVADDTDPPVDSDPAADDTDPSVADDTDSPVDSDPAADDTDPPVDTDPVAADDTDPSVADDTDAPEESDPPPPSHLVDGDPSDFPPESRFLNGSGQTVGVTWDADYVYAFVTHPDVRLGGSRHWVVLTFGSEGPRADEGVPIGTQSPGTPFGATRVVRWKADDSYDDASSWQPPFWNTDPDWQARTGGAIAEREDLETVELKMPRAALGLNGLTQLHIHLVFEVAGLESSYAAAPAGSFPEPAYDPDFTRWFDLDLDGSGPAVVRGLPPSDTGDTDLPVDTTETGNEPDTDSDPAADTDLIADSDPIADSDDTDAAPVDTSTPDTDPVDTDIVDTDPVDTDVVDTDPVDTEPVDTDVVDTDPVDTDVVDTDPADTDPADTDPADTDPADTDPVDTDIVDTDRLDTAAPAWSQPLVVDGFPDEWNDLFSFYTPSLQRAVITWTEDDVYAGLTHPDIATGTALHWLVITVGTGAGGDRTGAGFRTQQPGLPFGASTIIRWKADDSYTDALIWDGSSWVVEPGWILTRGAIAERNDRQTFELRVPRAALGLGDTLDIAMYMVFEGAGFETTFAPIPAGAFADGVYDPDVARWYRFNLAAPEPPAATPSSP